MSVVVEQPARTGPTTLGTFRAYFFGLFICTAGFLFGYDTGIVGGVLTLESFRHDFRFDTTTETKVSSLVVGLQQAGAFVAAIGVAPISERIGRRYSVMISCMVFCIGVILELVPSHSLPVFYVGRVISGLGLGSATAVVPTYSAEQSPKEIRGRLGSGMQWLFAWGVLLSYWIDYAVAVSIPPTSRQWMIPIALQMVPAVILGLGLVTQKESVRWLVKKDRCEEAWDNLKWIRADGSRRTQDELDEIRRAVLEERQHRQGWLRTASEPAVRRRLFLAFGVFLSQQCTGATALAYFGPQFFKLLVGGGSRDLLITGLFGVIKVVSTGSFLIFFSERLGRKQVLFYCSLAMAVCMTITAVIVKIKPPPGDVVTSLGIATVAMIFLAIYIYCFSWGPLAWVYTSEIFPSRIREVGVSVGVATQWLFNFMYSLVTPYMIATMGWGTFLFFAVMEVFMALFVFFCLEETQGKSIEEMEILFQSGTTMGVERIRNEVPEEDSDADKPDAVYIEQLPTRSREP